MKYFLMLVFMFAMAGCDRYEKLSQADGQVLCALDGKAYIVEHRILAVSKVIPVDSANTLCTCVAEQSQ